MRKIGLLLGALLVSINCYAVSNSVGSDLKSAIQKNATKLNSENNLAIIYGGQDFSHRIIATANESTWAGQATLIG